MSPENGSKDENTFACPYCTRDVPLDVSSCPACGVSYGSETIQLVKSFTKKALAEKPENKRKDDRVKKKFKVSYQSLNSFVNNYLDNMGKGGLFIKTTRPLGRGTRFQLRIQVPDGKEDLDVLCEVVWACTPEMAEKEENVSAGMGVRFLNLSAAGKARIAKILKAVG